LDSHNTPAHLAEVLQAIAEDIVGFAIIVLLPRIN